MTENGQLIAEAPKGELLVYRSEAGKIKLEVRLENETVWLTQKMMAELFQVGVNTINYHIKEIYECRELDREATIRKFRIVRDEVRTTDVTIAKNYLNEHEIDELNRTVVMWLDFAEDQARRRKRIFMQDWERKLDDFLRFNERQVLPHAGRVSKQSAEDHARAEYEKFSVRRRQYSETTGAAETIKQLEKAAKLLPEKRKGRKK
jgi:hypothetical protein